MFKAGIEMTDRSPILNESTLTTEPSASTSATGSWLTEFADLPVPSVDRVTVVVAILSCGRVHPDRKMPNITVML